MPAFTPWIKHEIAKGKKGIAQPCVFCSAVIVQSHISPLPEGRIYEHSGRLVLGEPLGNVENCKH